MTRTAIAAVALAALTAGCSSATATWSVKPSAGSSPTAARIFVAPAAVDIGAATGNVGLNFSDVQRVVTERLLSIVREADPSARLADTSANTPFLPMARYIEAVAPSRTTREEIDAAGYALQHGGTGLLVPTIVEWRQTRTDDPVGALTGPHDRLVIALRFVQLDPVKLSGSVTFENHAKLTLNQSADRLLNNDLRKTVLELLTPVTRKGP